MAGSSQHAALSTELAKLHERHLEDLRSAGFVGWTPQLLAACKERESRISNLRRHLARLLGEEERQPQLNREELTQRQNPQRYL